MAKSLRSIFFDVAAAINSRGKRINFKTDGQPDEALMQNLVDSATFFKETDDRARQAAGGNVEDEVGLVTVAPDTEAKAGTSGLTASRTKVVHARQLPDVASTESQVVDTFNDIALSVTVDAGFTTRNKFLVKLSTTFVSFMDVISKGISNLRTAVGISVGDTDMGTYTGAIITDNQTVKQNIQELEVAVEAGVGATGEVNTGSNVNTGGVGVFEGKSALDLQFRGINAGSNSVTVVLDAGNNKIDIDLDAANVRTNIIDGNFVATADEKSVASVGTGVFDFFAGLSGNSEQIKTLDSTSSINVNDVANILSFSLNETFLTDFINNVVTGGVGVGSAALYLFSAQSIAEVIIDDNTALSITKLPMPDDSSVGFYDHDNTWITSQWDANSAADGLDVEFLFSAVVTTTSIIGAGAQTVTFNIKITDGATTEIIATVVVNLASLTSGVSIPVSISGLVSSTTLTVVNTNDKVFVEVIEVGLGGAETVKIEIGANLYNLEV